MSPGQPSNCKMDIGHWIECFAYILKILLDKTNFKFVLPKKKHGILEFKLVVYNLFIQLVFLRVPMPTFFCCLKI